MRLCPFRSLDGAGMETGNTAYLEVGSLTNFPLAVEKLYHAPEAAQLVVGLALQVLMDDAVYRDVEILGIGQRDADVGFQTAEYGQGNHPVQYNAVDDSTPGKTAVHLIHRLAVHIIEYRSQLLPQGE